eukprot:659968-Amphidinium_carterae.1
MSEWQALVHTHWPMCCWCRTPSRDRCVTAHEIPSYDDTRAFEHASKSARNPGKGEVAWNTPKGQGLRN